MKLKFSQPHHKLFTICLHNIATHLHNVPDFFCSLIL